MPRTNVMGTTPPSSSGAQRCAQGGEHEPRIDSTTGTAATTAANRLSDAARGQFARARNSRAGFISASGSIFQIGQKPQAADTSLGVGENTPNLKMAERPDWALFRSVDGLQQKAGVAARWARRPGSAREPTASGLIMIAPRCYSAGAGSIRE
jgi:hypothetical protein